MKPQAAPGSLVIEILSLKGCFSFNDLGSRRVIAGLALRGTELANATAGTIRQRLLKIGALVTVSTRRVYVRLAPAFALQKLFAQVHRALVGLVAEDG
jgi:hypothetical protein